MPFRRRYYAIASAIFSAAITLFAISIAEFRLLAFLTPPPAMIFHRRYYSLILPPRRYFAIFFLSFDALLPLAGYAIFFASIAFAAAISFR
jgi:hypothetical protein